jgi:hypothetical protein
MRPQSIVMFERLFLASLVLSLLTLAVGYDEMAATLAEDPGMQQLGLGSGFLIAMVTVSYAAYLLLWYLIARKASKVAKWILVVFTAIGVLSALPSLAGAWTWTMLVSLAVYALEVGAVICLFQPDARAWLGGGAPSDPAAID